MVIDKFDDEYAFLSNFYPSKILYNGHKLWFAPTIEHAFQASKTIDAEEEYDIIMAYTPGQAKKLGRHCHIRQDWEEIKDDVMYKLLKKKFSIPELRNKLLATGDVMLIEGNWWHDNYWGSCACKKCNNNGKNKLGELLMQIRKELQKNEF